MQPCSQFKFCSCTHGASLRLKHGWFDGHTKTRARRSSIKDFVISCKSEEVHPGGPLHSGTPGCSGVRLRGGKVAVPAAPVQQQRRPLRRVPAPPAAAAACAGTAPEDGVHLGCQLCTGPRLGPPHRDAPPGACAAQ